MSLAALKWRRDFIAEGFSRVIQTRIDAFHNVGAMTGFEHDKLSAIIRDKAYAIVKYRDVMRDEEIHRCILQIEPNNKMQIDLVIDMNAKEYKITKVNWDRPVDPREKFRTELAETGW